MIVIDTHVLIWFVEGDTRLGHKARERIERVAMTADRKILAYAEQGALEAVSALV